MNIEVANGGDAEFRPYGQHNMDYLSNVCITSGLVLIESRSVAPMIRLQARRS